MKRRALIGGVASAGLAGCAVAPPDGDRQRTVALAGVDAPPSETSLTISVTVVESRITDAHSAQLRITVTNTGEDLTLHPPHGRAGCELFNRWDGGSDPPGLWLYSVPAAEEFDREPGRWVRDRSRDSPHVFPDYGCQADEYSPDASRSTEYVIWHDHREPGYLDPGTYRFEETLRVGIDDAEREYSWGFAITLGDDVM